MADQILVALSSYHRVDDMMPYLGEVAKRGTRVVFLIRYPLDRSLWLKDHWVTTESSRDAMLSGRLIMKRYSPERQRELAEERLAPWRRVLQNMGVEAIVNVYTGSLASVVKRYSQGGEVSLIMRSQTSLSVIHLLRRLLGFLGLFRTVGYRPVLLLRPGH
jgi:hypothetical protein